MGARPLVSYEWYLRETQAHLDAAIVDAGDGEGKIGRMKKRLVAMILPKALIRAESQAAGQK